jgi:hypothetical protein
MALRPLEQAGFRCAVFPTTDCMFASGAIWIDRRPARYHFFQIIKADQRQMRNQRAWLVARVASPSGRCHGSSHFVRQNDRERWKTVYAGSIRLHYALVDDLHVRQYIDCFQELRERFNLATDSGPFGLSRNVRTKQTMPTKSPRHGGVPPSSVWWLFSRKT